MMNATTMNATAMVVGGSSSSNENNNKNSNSNSNSNAWLQQFPSIFSSKSSTSVVASQSQSSSSSSSQNKNTYDNNNNNNNNSNNNNSNNIIIKPFSSFIEDADDKEKDDIRTVDEILSKEIFHLSMKDRNDIQEEIHGVYCLAPIETPQLISESLYELQNILNDNSIIPECNKYAYIQSQQHTQHTQQHTQQHTHISELENTGSSSRTKTNTTNTTSTNTTSTSTSTSTTSTITSYVNDINFRLRFLRCELFNVNKAAKRICFFLDLVLELFGNYALQRPIRISDFTKEEQKHLRKGRYQFMPFRDRAGRRILTIFPGAELENIPPNTHAKIALYMSWAAGYDIHTQRKGLLFLVWFDKSCQISSIPKKLRAKDHEVATVRASAIHICTPNTPFYRLRQSITTMRIGQNNRKKLKTHLGESVELKYMLQSYGITGDEIPISWSGTVKLTNIKKWMRMRILLEKQVQSHNELYYDAPSSTTLTTVGVVKTPTMTDTTSNNNNTNTTTITNNNINTTTIKSRSPSPSTSNMNPNTNMNMNMNMTTNNNMITTSSSMKMIECPYLNDVVFRQGTSAIGNPGNVTFRSMIESKLNVGNNSNNNTTTTTTNKNNTSSIDDNNDNNNNNNNGPSSKTTKAKATTNKIKTKRIVHEIMDDIKNNNNGRVLIWNDKGWWDVLMNEEHIYLKIEYIVREIRNTLLKKQRLALAAAAAAATEKGKIGNSSSSNSSQIINLNSGTSIFQSQDGTTNVTTANTSRIKRQRLNNCSNANDNSSDDDDGSNGDNGCNNNNNTAVCFGMKFIAW